MFVPLNNKQFSPSLSEYQFSQVGDCAGSQHSFNVSLLVFPSLFALRDCRRSSVAHSVSLQPSWTSLLLLCGILPKPLAQTLDLTVGGFSLEFFPAYDLSTHQSHLPVPSLDVAAEHSEHLQCVCALSVVGRAGGLRNVPDVPSHVLRTFGGKSGV